MGAGSIVCAMPCLHNMGITACQRPICHTAAAHYAQEDCVEKRGSEPGLRRGGRISPRPRS